MNQLVSRSTQLGAMALSSDQQEPQSRTLRRSREDGLTASLREARDHGGPLVPEANIAMSSSLKAKSRWRKQVDDAGALWNQLTEGDLQELEDHEHTLSELIQSRYRITQWEADRQVMAFIEDHMSSSM